MAIFYLMPRSFQAGAIHWTQYCDCKARAQVPVCFLLQPPDAVLLRRESYAFQCWNGKV